MLMMRLKVVSLFLLTHILTFSQSEKIVEKLILQVDTNIYSWPDDAIFSREKQVLPFLYLEENEICEMQVWPVDPSKKLELINSPDFEIRDSLILINNYYRFKVQFHRLTEQDFLKFSFRSVSGASQAIQDIPIQPYTKTSVSLYMRENTLFIGEEKIFEVITNNPDNILISNEWVTSAQADYRFRKIEGNLFLHLIPNQLSEIKIDIPLRSRKPDINTRKQLSFELAPLKYNFQVKASRLRYLNLDLKEIALDESLKMEGVEVQLDDNRLLHINKTYRIEDQEEKGGPLIAELFTKRRLANNKVLCILRPYSYHKKSEGYLYMKDGDIARFITNFDVIHATLINTISILRKGGEWKSGTKIYPGETVEVKLEGQGLHNTDFRFEDLIDITQDTLIRSETQALFKLKVPINISKKTINIYNYQQPTGKALRVAEYQEAREFDYLYLNYGDIGRKVSGIRGPILYQKTIKDVVINFNDHLIDNDGDLHGIQYLDIDFRITGKRNQLIEMRSIENIVICPGDKSPRFNYYNSKNCLTEDISLNKYLSRKTYDLDEWSKISMTIKNDQDKYGGDGYQKEIDIILKRNYSFDIEVSFPAGLITISEQEDGEMGFGSLSGISMAMIAQFSFYHPEKIAKYRPYKIGAGFLAFNAFNFSDNADNRDVGIVILGSLYPTTRDVKLSFPLYVGGGYFLKDRKWFFLIGPGIRVRL